MQATASLSFDYGREQRSASMTLLHSSDHDDDAALMADAVADAARGLGPDFNPTSFLHRLALQFYPIDNGPVLMSVVAAIEDCWAGSNRVEPGIEITVDLAKLLADGGQDEIDHARDVLPRLSKLEGITFINGHLVGLGDPP